MFSCSRNKKVSFKEKPQLKIISFLNYIHWYLIHIWLETIFNSTIVNGSMKGHFELRLQSFQSLIICCQPCTFRSWRGSEMSYYLWSTHVPSDLDEEAKCLIICGQRMYLLILMRKWNVLLFVVNHDVSSDLDEEVKCLIICGQPCTFRSWWGSEMSYYLWLTMYLPILMRKWNVLLFVANHVPSDLDEEVKCLIICG